MVRQFIPSDKASVHALWNAYAPKNGYSELTREQLDALIFDNEYFSSKFMYILLHKDKPLGFVLGACNDALPAGRERAYFSCLVLEENTAYSQNADLLMDVLEGAFVSAGRQFSDVLFFSPFHLPWIIPNTPGHQHNNAPGIWIETALYSYMLARGYAERAQETAMYLPLSCFVLSESCKSRLTVARKKGYDVCLYSKSQHFGLGQMLGSLGNPLWEKEILSAAEENLPFLVAVQANEVVGFAGPIYPEASGRGYFTGMGVMPQHEGIGLGTVLFNMLCREEAQNGAAYMSLFTGEKNSAKRIYQSAGFADKRSFAVMRKNIMPKGGQ